MENNIVKFTIIVICFIMAATNRDGLNKRDRRLLTAAMAATLAADFFLVLIFAYLPGLVFFCAVQMVYAVRCSGKRILLFMPAVLVIPVVFFAYADDILITLAITYAQLFIISYACMIKALWRGRFPKPNSVLIFVGMTLFVLCDVNVALWNLGHMGFITNHQVINFASGAMWLFYAPSQVCLALSGIKFQRDKQAITAHCHSERE